MQQTEKNLREFKGVWIPKEIWLDEDLSIQEKVLMAEIDSFESANGCFASNSYLGKFLGLSPSRVSGMISKLISKEFLESNITYKPLSKEVDKRYLKINKSKIYINKK